MKHEQIQEYYGKVLQSSDDLQTNACCTDTDMPDYIKGALSKVHDEVMARYYGCGLVNPEALKGMGILDLGSGSGRDCYVLSQLVGEDGAVVGVDMTDEQLEVANQHLDYHTEAFGYGASNVSFHKGYIERLNDLNLADNSFDLIVSNCVINLSPDKEAVLREAYRLLKPGGEVYFSDVYSDRRIPSKLADDPLLYGECLSGAFYWQDFLSTAKSVGFLDPRLVEDRPLTIDNPAIQERVGHIRFYSATYRLFKLPDLDDQCEDYGQAVIYKGTVEHHPHSLTLDKHHLMETGKVFTVCRNTWQMLHETRLRPHFDFIGEGEIHYGIFEGCGTNMPFDPSANADQTSGVCC